MPKSRVCPPCLACTAPLCPCYATPCWVPPATWCAFPQTRRSELRREPVEGIAILCDAYQSILTYSWAPQNLLRFGLVLAADTVQATVAPSSGPHGGLSHDGSDWISNRDSISASQAVGPVAVTSLLLGSGLERCIDVPLQLSADNPNDPAAQEEYNRAAIQVCLH